ncbi:MAG: DoxX family membrane protein [Gemmatimonadetes bacterium]|nr:DoxX family membrane protein [Gemmatimonadota bacterium]
MTEIHYSRWTTPALRVGMGLFLLAWGLDKLLATQGSVRIFSGFYGMDLGALAIQVVGVAEILLAVALAAGLFRVLTAWAQFVVNGVSTVASWKQILDPWGVFGLTKGGTHLFLASIVITAASIVLVLNARDPTFSLDRRLGRSGTG